MNLRQWLLIGCLAAGSANHALGQSVVGSDTYRRIKAGLDAVPAIDTHDHLWPFDRIPGLMETDRGRGMILFSLWRSSYYPQVGTLTARQPGEPFDPWWARAKHDFDNTRATGFYRYQLPAFRDLYGVDFDRITDEQAKALDTKIFDNYRDDRWVRQVVTEKANIELMLNDPYWGRLDFRTHYPFEVLVFNVTTLLDEFHPSEFKQPSDDPYRFAHAQGLKVETLDDYLAVLDRLFREAKSKGAVCLKTTRAYERTLRFEDVPKERAARIFGRPRGELSPQEVKDFQDFLMWRLVGLSAAHDLPFQIHTGHGQLQGSNPLPLLDLIEANPKTKFILFHGGYPWVGETGAILLRHNRHVWIDAELTARTRPELRSFHGDADLLSDAARHAGFNLFGLDVHTGVRVAAMEALQGDAGGCAVNLYRGERGIYDPYTLLLHTADRKYVSAAHLLHHLGHVIPGGHDQLFADAATMAEGARQLVLASGMLPDLPRLLADQEAA